jgi:hypothetical protein
MIYMVDIDGTICNNTYGDYENAVPILSRIERVNELCDEGNTIFYWTARGGNTGLDWSELTKKQLNEWGCKYHELRMKKPKYDMWIDDKAVNAEVFFR